MDGPLDSKIIDIPAPLRTAAAPTALNHAGRFAGVLFINITVQLKNNMSSLQKTIIYLIRHEYEKQETCTYYLCIPSLFMFMEKNWVPTWFSSADLVTYAQELAVESLQPFLLLLDTSSERFRFKQFFD